MAFWSSERIRDIEQKKEILIDGERHHLIDKDHFKPDRVVSGKYELALSRQVIVTPDGTKDLPKPGRGPTLTIPPGQYAILYTEERVTVPNYAIAFISIKFGFTYKGLVNISGFHVDPGFSGHLKFSVFNAGNHPIYIDYGTECFQIWFSDMEPTKEGYRGNHRNQGRITTTDRDQMSEMRHSPGALNERIEELERHFKIVIAVGIIVIVPLLIGLAVAIFDHWLSDKNNIASKGEFFAVGEIIFILCLVVGFFGAIFFALYQKNKTKVDRFCDKISSQIEK